MPPPRSLDFLASLAHVPPQLLRALLASFPDSSPSPPCPQAFELPGAQVYCQRHDGPASPMAAHAIWGFFRWSLMPVPLQPTPHPMCPGETLQRGECAPTLRKEVALSQGRKQACSGQKEALPCANHGIWRECVLSSRDGRWRGEGTGNQEAGADKDARRLCEATRGMEDEQHFSCHSEQVQKNCKEMNRTTTLHPQPSLAMYSLATQISRPNHGFP